MSTTKLYVLASFLFCGTLLEFIGARHSFAATADYQAEVLADNPFLYYRLGENSGTVADDLSGSMRDGTFVGTPTLGVPGLGEASDTAVMFDGASQYVIGPSSANSFGSSLGQSSFEFVFSSTATNPMALSGTFNTGSVTGYEVNLNRSPAGGTLQSYIRLYLRDDTGADMGAAFPSPAAFDGDFHHVLFTYNSSGASDEERVKAYLDGIEQPLEFSGGNENPGPSAFSSFAFSPAFATRNNRSNLTDQLFTGVIDEVALYTSTLTADDAFARATALGIEPSILTLVVNTTTGEVRIRNAADDPIPFDYYLIESANNALNTGTWNSLADQDFDAGSPADFDNNGSVDAADLNQWKGDYGLNSDSDADGDNDSDGQDFLIWQRQFGQPVGPADSWLEAGGASSSQLAELRLGGASILASNNEISLGNAFDTSVFGSGVDGDLTFSFGAPGQPLSFGRVVYESGSSATTIPEPATAIVVLLGLSLSLVRQSRPRH